MSPTCTRRRPLSPPDSGAPFARLAVALAAVLLVAASAPACGRSKSENRIKPITATLNIIPFSGTPDPAVFLEKLSQSGDLVTVNVKLHTSSPITFDAFTLEFHYDPTLVQVSDVFDFNPGLLGDCNSGSPCQPLCQINAEAANTNGTLLIAIASPTDLSTGATCQTATVSSDTTLLTMGFVAATTIEPPNPPSAPPPGRITLYTNPDPSRHGDCEILNALADQGVPCLDLNATMTASR